MFDLNQNRNSQCISLSMRPACSPHTSRECNSLFLSLAGKCFDCDPETVGSRPGRVKNMQHLRQQILLYVSKFRCCERDIGPTKMFSGGGGGGGGCCQ